MPGIVGFITKMPREWSEHQLSRMVETIRHESFYETGTWVDESSGIYVGWATRKNAFSDGMPLCNERGNVVLVFSGEEFPEPGTAGRLKERGHVFETGGPSYLVHMSEEDPTFPAGLNGRFQGLLTDKGQRTATLFNDRYGMHRIYYHESKEAFYFAAEAKAILAVRPELRTADPRGLGEFVSCGCVLENRTLFKGIHVLPPASAWTFQNGSLSEKNSVLSASGMGGPISSGARSVLSGTCATFFAEPSSILQWPGTGRDVPHRGTGHADDHGMAEAVAGISSLLLLRRSVPRLPGRALCAKIGPGLRTTLSGDPGRRTNSSRAFPTMRNVRFI